MTRTLISALTALLLTAGCGGGEAGPSPSPDRTLSNGSRLSEYVDACSLVSDEQLTRWLGAGPHKKQPTRSGIGGVAIPEPTFCFISSSPPNPAHVNLSYAIEATPERARSKFESGLQIETGEVIPGLGDAAYRSRKDGLDDVNVLSGRVLFTAGYSPGSGKSHTSPESEAQEVEVARAVLASLGNVGR